MFIMKDDEMAIPHLFRCPITLDLFTDPVTLCTGQTYDRSSIEKWIAAGNLTCPVTMQKLHDPSMVPNHTLRHLIDQWLHMGYRFDPDLIKIIDPDLSLATLKHNLESQQATMTTKLETLEKIKIVSEELPLQRCGLIQLGFFQVLLHLLFGNGSSPIANLKEEELKIAELALTCVLKLLPFSDLRSLDMLKQDSSLVFFLVLLQQGTSKVKTSLCYLIEEIATSSETKDLCEMLGQNPRFLQELIALLNPNVGASDAGIKAISVLCCSELIQESFVSEGLIDGLLAYISTVNRGQASMALATLELLLGLENARKAVIKNPNAVHILVKMIFRVSDHEGSESAVSSLLIVCYESLKLREEAISAGVLTQLLLLLQSQCSCRAKNKARVLLKLLRSMWVEDPNVCKLQYGLVDA
ncbi:U-box domain-containing protein 26-like [Telopea speciosissima]|uniref:U-box domain-containing protein 26-like n=1 Tax=Telopea speciosissima TaxID=54955 RepID=UPI001CC6F373|nr:U-box domain-containing protein 26-like [Telopea speciosissima]